jgi:hypothetical protein
MPLIGRARDENAAIACGEMMMTLGTRCRLVHHKHPTAWQYMA